ncbi:hypothetical protein F4781DRAFT_411518 [Annulohypoxylon bovei var. microspora]|nr:hypothetical protein F4781DRAFT_411518 [Annulohypoxylon bovei var. microspora]
MVMPDQQSEYFIFSEISSSDCIRCQILALIVRASSIHKTEDYGVYLLQEHAEVVTFVLRPHGALTLFTSTDYREVDVPYHIPKRRSGHTDTSTEASFLWAREQIEGHQRCCQSQGSGSFVPTRLISVNPGSLDGDVVLDDCVPTGSRYVTLGVLRSSSLTVRGRLLPCWLSRDSGYDSSLGHWRSGLKILDCTYMDDGSYLSSWNPLRRVYLLEVGKSSDEDHSFIHFLIL